MDRSEKPPPESQVFTAIFRFSEILGVIEIQIFTFVGLRYCGVGQIVFNGKLAETIDVHSH